MMGNDRRMGKANLVVTADGREHAIKPRQVAICVAMAELSRLREGMPATIREIAAVVGCSSSTVQYNLDSLLRMGLVARVGTTKGRSWRLRGAVWSPPTWVSALREAALASGIIEDEKVA